MGNKSCVTCKHHSFNEVDEHFYCVLKKHNVNCSEHSEWVSDEQDEVEDENVD